MSFELQIRNRKVDESDQPLGRYKMVLVGSAATGKTTTVFRLLHNRFIRETYSTIGMSFTCIKYFMKNAVIEAHDISSQEHYQSLVPIYVKGAHLVLLFYDASDNREQK